MKGVQRGKIMKCQGRENIRQPTGAKRRCQMQENMPPVSTKGKHATVAKSGKTCHRCQEIKGKHATFARKHATGAKHTAGTKSGETVQPMLSLEKHAEPVPSAR